MYSYYQPPGAVFPAPSAPPPYDERGLRFLSYDQVVRWWNSLTEEQCGVIQTITSSLPDTALDELRMDYQEYYPKEYYPRETYESNEFSACDFYLMYYCGEQMYQRYAWFRSSNLLWFFTTLPPSADDHRIQPPTIDAAENWWNSLIPTQQQEIQARVVTRDQLQIIRQEYAPYYRYYSPSYCCYYQSSLGCYDYYLVSRYNSRLYGYHFYTDDYCRYLESLQLARLTACTGYYAAQVCGNVRAASGSHHGRGRGVHRGESSSILVGLLLVLTAAASAIVGALYAGIKVSSSIDNLLHGRKILRSLWRLGCVAGGAYVGAIQGAALGALVGSAVPGIGTVTGAIIGAIFGAPITAALAGAFAKQSARLVSWSRTRSTNPEKWQVEKVAGVFSNGNSMTTAQVDRLFKSLRQQKNKHKSAWNPFKGAITNTADHQEKNRYNKFLAAMKENRQDPCQWLRVDRKTRFIWDGLKVRRQDIELPPLKCGLRR